MSLLKNVCRKYQFYKYCSKTFLGKRHLSVVVSSGVSGSKPERLSKSSLFLSPKGCSSDFAITEIEEVTGIYPYSEGQQLNQSDETRRILFQNNPDEKSLKISKCASVEDVFQFVRANVNALDYKHLSQIVLALHDLQTIFIYQYGEEGEVESKETFFRKLLEHKELYMVLDSIKRNLASYEPEFLSYTIVHLNKLGLSEESTLIQDLALRLRDHLLGNFRLCIAARLFRVIFMENSVRPLHIVQDLIPDVLRQIELVNNPQDLEALNICLLRLSVILTDDILLRYERKVNELIESQVLTEDHYQLILWVLSVFNIARWRNKHSPFISKCILLMKNSIEKLNLQEMHHLYDIFFKNQEPGEVLNTIQRAAARLLQEMDETEQEHTNKLKLFSSVIYFSSPVNKSQFRRDINKYMHEENNFHNLLTLRKIFTYLKISDPKLCDLYWNKACQVMKKENDFGKTLKLVDNYMYFCGDFPGFRHYAFEHHVSTVIEKTLKAGTLTLFPGNFFSSLAFILMTAYNDRLLNSLLRVFEEMRTQMTPMHIYKLSYSVLMLGLRNPPETSPASQVVSKALHQQTARLHAQPQDISTSALMVRAAILRKDVNNELIDDLLTSLKECKHMSSKIMEYICFNLFSTKSLIPEVVNLCTNYIIQHKSNIVGFNAEKILHMLYQLNYQPVYEQEFFETAINIIIRDQERMSGLAFLQSALSLCFFQRMPKSFIKQIFNVEFLDKLDVELENCYFRDKYPLRVRRVLMLLNRAVCLEYPEYNVPWFHQKYIEEYQKTNAIDDLANPIHLSVKSYLLGILGEEAILESATLPYGYEVNFVYHLDRHKKPTKNFDDPQTIKYALLIKHDNDFTRMYVRLRGQSALKHRHLEILGYRVKAIKWSEWVNLLYSKERVDYVTQLVFS